MTASPAEASAFLRSAMAVAGPLRERMAGARNGFLSIEDAAWLRTTLGEISRLRAKGERLAAGLDCPEFAEWAEELREVETSLQTVVASMKPIRAN